MGSHDRLSFAELAYIVSMSFNKGRHEGKRGRHKGSAPSSRRTSRGERLSLLTAALVLGLGVTAVFADGGDLDVEVANNTQYANDQTTDGAIVEYIGSNNVDFGSSGSGVFEAFLRTHDSPAEKGYNKDATKASPFEFDEVGGQFTHSILVSEIPVVECESVDGSVSVTDLCWELFADINDSNNTPLIQLTDLELYFTADPSLNGYPFAGTATKVYDFEGSVKIRDVNPGSGRGDLRYLVPLDGITLPGDCGYGSSTCTTYFVVYTEWGDPSGGSYSTDAGFNEWKVRRYPFLSVTKDAETSFTRTFAWTIDKSVSPDTWELFDGDTGTSDWTVAVTKDEGTDSNWAVSGTITIENPSDQDAIIASVTDEISGVGPVTADCGVTFPYELPEGESLVCTYSSALPDGTNRTNTATATLDTSQVFTGEADIIFGEPTTLVNDTVTVVDDRGPLNESVSDDDEFTYPETFECPDDGGTHDNTASIVETGQSDDASVTVTCHDLSVSKTAFESRTRTYEWEIDKSVDPDTWDLFTGDTGTSEYTVTVTKTGFTDSEWHVEGTITVHNNHPTAAATLTDVSDEISGFGAVTVDCPSLTVPAGGDLVCTYEADLPDGSTRTNTATATQQNYDYDSSGAPTADGTTDYTDDEPIDFSEAVTTEVNATINVDDTYAGDLGSFSDTGSTSYERSFECDADEGTHDNTATIVETAQSDDASVTVNCYALVVTKDADESFDREYEWSIDKTSETTELTLNPGETFEATYEVTVDVISTTDSGWAVEGDISVDNPAPVAAELTGVSDVVSPAIAATVECGVTFPYVLAAGGTLNCTYSADLPDATSRTNTATATLQNYDYDSGGLGTASGTTDFSGNANVDFSEAIINEIDECIDVTDTFAGFLGTVCASDALPHTFTYPWTIGPYDSSACDTTFEVTNTSSFETNDTGATGSDDHTIVVTIECPFEGCTPGFWQGGVGFDLWNEPGDADFSPPGGNSFGHATQFNTYFAPVPQLNGLTMLDVVGTGGGKDPARKAARSLIAAYLNAESDLVDYPFTTTQLEAMWADAVANNTFLALHTQLDTANNLGCPIGSGSSAWILLPLTLVGGYFGWRWNRGRHEHRFEADL